MKMARAILMKKGAREQFNDCAFNSSYEMNLTTLTALQTTLNCALSVFDVVTAVRLDFSIKMAPEDQCIGACDSDIVDCFEEFTNRLYKSKRVEYFMNWKLEWSELKGYHIHTVFYFNHELTKSFTLNSDAFRDFKSRWDKVTDENGNINICQSGLADTEDSYSVRGPEIHHYVLLTKNVDALNDLSLSDSNVKFHQQKNKQQKKCGFFYWISYLAKTDQKAMPFKKRFGSKSGFTLKEKITAPNAVID